MKRIIYVLFGIVILCVMLSQVAFGADATVEQSVCSGNALGTFNGSIACMSGNNLHICINNFPDEKFRTYILDRTQESDTNHDEMLTEQEASNLVNINCSNLNIADLSGIEFFTSVRFLTCDGNMLTELDVSKNVALYVLGCSNNQLTKLTLGNLPILGMFNCNNNQLTELDISQCPALEILRCSENKLTDINVSNNSWLYCLECDGNQLTELCVGDGFYDISCSKNQIEYLDLSHCEGMDYFSCVDNPLKELKLPSKIPTSDSVILAYGTCGDDTCWRLDDSGKLTIYGVGSMDNYSSNPETDIIRIPYYELRDRIQCVRIEAGVTSIGDYAFYPCASLSSVEIPASVTDIGSYAFDNLWHVLYAGSKEQWDAISFRNNDAPLLKVTRHYNCSGNEVIDPVNKTCSICQANCTHTWDNSKVTKTATCKEAGETTYTCTACSATKTEPIAKLTSHSWDSGKVTKAATCKESGLTTYTCTACNTTRTEPIAKTTSHTPGAAATSTTAQTCTICGIVLTPATGTSTPAPQPTDAPVQPTPQPTDAPTAPETQPATEPVTDVTEPATDAVDPTQPTTEDVQETDPAPTPGSEETPKNTSGVVITVTLVTVVLAGTGGGALYFFKFRKKP